MIRWRTTRSVEGRGSDHSLKMKTTQALAGVLSLVVFCSSRRRHTRFDCDWSSDVCSSDLSRHSSRRRSAASAPAIELAIEHASDALAQAIEPGALPPVAAAERARYGEIPFKQRSEEHTSELQSQSNLVCRLLLEKKKKTTKKTDRDLSYIYQTYTEYRDF